MAIPTKSLDEIVARALANFRTSFPGKPLGTKTFLGRSARAVALNVWGLQKSIEDADRDAVPASNSSDDALSEWAFTLGLPNGAGGYGRFVPTAASGGEATLTGTRATVYPINSTATAEDGSTQIKLAAAVTLPGTAPGSSSATGSFTAVTTGTVGNLPAGTVCTWDSPPAGADPSFTITSALGGGLDKETNASVYARIIARLQTPPRGGSSADYIFWAEDVDGIREAWIYPHRSGLGSVDVVIGTGGTGTGRTPTSAQQTAVETAIEAVRPCAVGQVNVLLPYNAATGKVIRCRVVPSLTKYAFDWDDTAASYTVDTYTAGSPATLKLNTLAPASLKSAITAYIAGTGPQPRLQVISTGSVINTYVGTSSTTTWSDSGGKTTITLDTLPDGWVAPTAGDKVFAYGPVVDTIASGILSLVDSLGPSLVSGYGDPLSVWFDKLTISGISAVAESAIDTDGTELIREVPVGYVTIDGSAGDVQANDNVPGQAPEILYAKSIAVTA